MSRSRRALLATLAVGLSALAFAPGLVADEATKTRKLVMIAGTPSHGPGDHEFNAGVLLLQKCLVGVPGLETVVCLNGYPQDDSMLDTADAILCYADGGGNHPLIRGQRLERIGALMDKGVGLMCCHYGVEVPKDLGGAEFRKWIGGHYEHMYSCNPMWKPEFTAFPDHPICRGVRPFSVRDEWYFRMRFRDDMAGVTPILSAVPPDKVRDGPYAYPKGPYPHIQADKGKNRPEVMMWATERADGGRGVGFTGGHFHRNWLDPNFRKIVLNALLWVSQVDVPANGVESEVTEDDIKQNLDPKGKKR